MLLAIAPDARLEPRGKRVDDRHADAMQAARDLVGVLVELAAGVQLREDDLGRRPLGIVVVVLLDADRNAATVVADRHRAVGIEGDQALRGMPCQDLVDGVVDDLVDHVVQARTVVRVADVHARPLANGIQALEHLDGVLAVLLGRARLLCRRRVHVWNILEIQGNLSIVKYTTPAAGRGRKSRQQQLFNGENRQANSIFYAPFIRMSRNPRRRCRFRAPG